MDATALIQDPLEEQQAEQPQATPVDQLIGISDGQFYADLVKDGVGFIEPAAFFGRRVMAEIAGLHGENPLMSLESTDSKCEDMRKPVSIHRRVLEVMLPVMCPPEQTASIEPKREDARFEALRQKYRAEALMKEVQFEDVDRETCIQAYLTGYGVRFTCPAVGILTLIANEDVDDGTPMTWPVSVVDGDYSCDPAARRPQEDRFRAARFRFSKRLALKHGFINENDLGKLEYCDRTGEQTHEDLFWLWVVVVYERNCIRWGMLYKPGENDWYMELQDWCQDGHPDGPIEVTRVKPVRSTKNRAISPAMQIASLNAAWVRIIESNVQRAALEKTVIVGQGGTPRPLIEQLYASPHLGYVEMSGAIMPSAIPIGGMTKSQVDVLAILNDNINNETPNLQQSSGNKGISDTAREAMILQNNANRLMSDLSAACQRSRSRVLGQIMFYDFYGRQQVGGVDVSIPVTTVHGTSLVHSSITPADREADYFDMTFEVTTSQANQIDPAVKLDLLTMLSQSLPTTIATIVQLGGNPDPLINQMAELSGLDSLREMFPTQSAQLVMAAKQQEAMTAQAEGVQGGSEERKQRSQQAGGQTPMGMMGKMTPMVQQPAAAKGVQNATA